MNPQNFKLNYLSTLIILFIITVFLDSCSLRKKTEDPFLFDDTIPRINEPKPPVIFYKGHFFQYFPTPVKNPN